MKDPCGNTGIFFCLFLCRLEEKLESNADDKPVVGEFADGLVWSRLVNRTVNTLIPQRCFLHSSLGIVKIVTGIYVKACITPKHFSGPYRQYHIPEESSR